MKKYLALVLVLVMALGLFAACDTADTNSTTDPKGTDPAGTTAPAGTTEPAPKDPVTLVWHIRGVGTQTDHAKVEEEFNKLLQSRPGFEHITVKLMHNVAAEHAATVERAYTAKEQIDIVCTVNLQPVQMARDGYFLGLSEYFDEHSTLWETYPEWLWETQYVDDDYYVVPNYQRGHNPKTWILDAKWADVVDWEGFCALVKWENGYSVGSMEEILNKIEEMYLAIKASGKEGADKVYLANPLGYLTGYSQNLYWHEYLENLTPDGGATFADHNTAKVNSLWLTDEWYTVCKKSAEWADKGYYPIDVATAEPGTYNFGEKGNYFLVHTQCLDWDDASQEAWAEQTYGVDCLTFRHVDKVYMENRWAANGNAISSTCENPEDAVAFLELLGTDVELYNMLVYGLEGTHWEWVDKETNQIKTLQYDGSQASGEAPYGMLKWCVGNTFNAYLNQACTLTENTSALYLNENGVPAPWAGVKIDTTPIATQRSNCAAVWTEWNTRLSFGQDGVDGFEAAFAEFISQMKAAGVEDIIEEMQNQIDDYIASKK